MADVVSLLDHPRARDRLAREWSPRRVMAAARRRAQMSTEEFATAVAQLIACSDLTAAVIRAWEAGRATPPPEAVEAALRLIAIADVSAARAEAASIVAHDACPPDQSDVRRREFLVGFAALGSSLFGGDPERALAMAAGRSIGAADVDVIREMTLTFRQMDNRFGGGRVHRVVTHQVDREILPLLESAECPYAVRRQLLEAAAELTHLAGWIAFDVGDHRQAGRYLRKSLKFAEEAGASAFACEILAGVSHHAAFRGDGDAAVDLAQAARGHLAHGEASPALVAETWAMEAHGHALRGDQRECGAAMANAQRTLDKASGDDRPAWLGYFDEAYLSAKFGHTYRALGRPVEAVGCAVRSLDMSDGYERGRLFNTTLLAAAHADLGEIDAACELGERAMDLAESVQSSRTMSHLDGLRRQLLPHQGTPAVQALTARMQAMSAGTAAT
jgi:DNA-binding transcriptional regulator YiaG